MLNDELIIRVLDIYYNYNLNQLTDDVIGTERFLPIATECRNSLLELIDFKISLDQAVEYEMKMLNYVNNLIDEYC